MNNVSLIGRLTKDPDLRFTTGDTAVTNVTIAVDKFVKGEKQADFVPVTVWGKQAESLAQYMNKGSKIGVVGSIQSGSYEDADGNIRYTLDVVADRIEFLESKKEEEATNNKSNSKNTRSNYKRK